MRDPDRVPSAPNEQPPAAIGVLPDKRVGAIERLVNTVSPELPVTRDEIDLCLHWCADLLTNLKQP